MNKRKILLSAVILLVIMGILVGLYAYAHKDLEKPQQGADYVEYETGKVKEILTDSCEQDQVAEGAYRGQQTILVEITSGQYKGETLMAENTVGPMYGEPAKVGQHLTLTISTYENGDHWASVYEYNREIPIYGIIALFFAVTILVGGKTGAKSIVGLGLTVAVLLWVLLPLLLLGWNTVMTTFFLCSLVAVACFVLLGGVDKKTVCACLGTIAGMALAMGFGLLAQGLTHVDGLRAEDAEALLQLRQTGTPVGIRGLLTAGIIVSALGAVMDVAMSIASAMAELKAVNPDLKRKDLWRSGMNIGRDMVGTMTNTLILAFLGSGFVQILYFHSLGLSYHQLMSSAYMGMEVVSGISSAIGVILAVPVTALIGSWVYGAKKEEK